MLVQDKLVTMVRYEYVDPQDGRKVQAYCRPSKLSSMSA
jgi:hypothetical protein